MRILFGITKSNFGGAQRYVLDMSVEAKKVGYKVSVLCGGEGVLVKKLKSENIEVISLPSLGRDVSFIQDMKVFFDILNILKKDKPDVFHINSSKIGGIGSLAGRVSGVNKIIFTAHAWAFNEPRPFWQKPIIKFLSWLTVLLAHKTICVSENLKQSFINWPFTKNKLVVVHNGVKDFDLVNRTDAELTVGTIAELHKVKGLDVLLRAWKGFVNKHQARLVIIGDGEEKDNLEKLSTELNISDSVIFKGFLENARSMLSTFDIFVLPSRSEALSIAILEAGVAGLPVVASDVGGIPEIIENEKNGLLVPKENSEALLSALTRLAEDKNLREKLGANLKQTISTKFSFERMVQKTFGLYK